jgi:hypothetical protein
VNDDRDATTVAPAGNNPEATEPAVTSEQAKYRTQS